MTTLLITNGQLVLPDRVIPNGEIYIEDGIIRFAGRQNHHYGLPETQILNAAGGIILPGFIDTHSDAIEKELEPRPGAFFSAEVAFSELEKKLAGQGITTMYHSFSFAGAEIGVRHDQTAADYIRRIVAMTKKQAIIRNKIHLRFEITNYAAVEIIQSLIGENAVDLLSFMDHTPGQGQYPTIEDYHRYLVKTYHLPVSEIGKILEIKERGRLQAQDSIHALSAVARKAGIPLASHDDDSREQIEQYRKQGISISEFPINLSAAAAARRVGLDVSVGAPNVVRGGSTGKGLRALDAITAGCANMICSDYYPPSILHAVFMLADKVMSLAEAVAMATRVPAKALRLSGLGSLEEGNAGDVIIVKRRSEIPVVVNTIVGGARVYDLNYREHLAESLEQSVC